MGPPKLSQQMHQQVLVCGHESLFKSRRPNWTQEHHGAFQKTQLRLSGLRMSQFGSSDLIQGGHLKEAETWQHFFMSDE